MNLYAVIMAGGRGERFWPMGRRNTPKQLLKLSGSATMIEETALRLFPLIPPENLFVATNRSYVEQIRALLPIPEANVIGEPEGRDTAPCAALVAALLRRRDPSPDATMIMLPADHVIKPAKALQQTLKDAADAAALTGALVTIGVEPDRPATGYGYIHCGEKVECATRTVFHKVVGFREKPDAVTAKRFLDSGSFKWNSGIFIWKISAILEEFKRQTPDLAGFAEAVVNAGESELESVVKRGFAKCERISLDFAIMEGAGNVMVADAPFSWDDVGSWTAIRRQFPADAEGNVCRGLTAVKDCTNCIVISDDDHLTGVIGMDDVVVVKNGNATLVCPTSRTQQVRDLVLAIAARHLEDYY